MKQDPLSRRDALRLLGGGALAACAFPRGWAWAEDKPKRKVLYFTKSVGFQHSVVKRDGDKLSHSEKILKELGEKHGFEVTCTKDGRVFDGDISMYDAFFFYTAGNLLEVGKDDQAPPMSPKGKEALLAAVKAGKGLLGSHSASDSFHSKGKQFETQKEPDPYIAMLGGEFIRHGANQKARLRVVDPKFPGLKSAGQSIELFDEWYSLKNFAPDLHVILVQETEGMKGPDYQRPPFPQTWARKHGKGRVFYTSLAHLEDVWTNPLLHEILLGALSWATGNVEADVTPNVKEVTPQADTLPPEK